MSSIKAARQRQKVKRVGIHAAFTPEGKERSEKEIKAYNEGNKRPGKAKGAKDRTNRRKSLDKAIDSMSSRQSTNKANKRNYV